MKLKHITKSNIKCFNCNKVLDIKLNGIYNSFYKIIYKCNCLTLYSWTLFASIYNSNKVLCCYIQLNKGTFIGYSTERIYNQDDIILISRESFLNLIKDFDIERIKEKYDTLILFK